MLRYKIIRNNCRRIHDDDNNNNNNIKHMIYYAIL